MLMDETGLRDIADRVLSASSADQTEVLVYGSHSALTRFANSYIHQNVAQKSFELSVRAVIGKKIGIAATNILSDESLKAVAEKAVTLARHQKENEDFKSLPAPAPLPQVRAYVEGTAEYTPEARAEVVADVCDAARREGATAAGAFKTGVSEMAVANSLGVFAYHRDTLASINTTMMSATSSGYASQLSVDVEDIDGKALAAEALDRCLRSTDPAPLEPGEYDVILEDYAVADILDFFAYLAFGAQAYQEKRSFMTGRLGEKVMGENISIWDDGLSPDTIANPFDFEGAPRQRVDFIANGVAKDIVYDTYYAGKDGTTSTGHALPAAVTFGPIPSNMFLGPGNASKEEMVSSVERGIWVSRFWYTRPVHPLRVIVTGMTRDGTFLIEKGKITRPVRNLRFTQGYLDAMSQVEMIGGETRLHDAIAGVSRVPALKVRSWNFSGATEF
jgi:predicted Zn-dependent protease